MTTLAILVSKYRYGREYRYGRCRTGLPGLVLGALNVAIPKDYLVTPYAVVGPEAYQHVIP